MTTIAWTAAGYLMGVFTVAGLLGLGEWLTGANVRGETLADEYGGSKDDGGDERPRSVL